MPPQCDYECMQCADRIERDCAKDIVFEWCGYCEREQPHKRKWTPPHTGFGSSGEPPR